MGTVGVIEHMKKEKKETKKRRRTDAASAPFGGTRTCMSVRRFCRSSPSVFLQYSVQVAVCARTAHACVRHIVGAC